MSRKVIRSNGRVRADIDQTAFDESSAEDTEPDWLKSSRLLSIARGELDGRFYNEDGSNKELPKRQF